MPDPLHAQRSAVLNAAASHGWEHDMGVFDDANIVRDTFTGELGIVRVVWLRTPWSSSRFTGGLYSEKATKKDRNLWSITARGGVLEALAAASNVPVSSG